MDLRSKPDNVLRALMLTACLTLQGGAQRREPRLFIRANQLGYLPQAPKAAVLCALDSLPHVTYNVVDAAGATVLRRTARSLGSFASCRATFRLDFTAVVYSGTYSIRVNGAEPVAVRIADN
ncbi:MAG: cellulase N-terminal Ig-like domain-containing protein, partial [Gemmatimonadaceae bacterium]